MEAARKPNYRRTFTHDDGTQHTTPEATPETLVALERQFKEPLGECLKWYERTLWLNWHALKAAGLIDKTFEAWKSTITHVDVAEDEAVPASPLDPAA